MGTFNYSHTIGYKTVLSVAYTNNCVAILPSKLNNHSRGFI